MEKLFTNGKELKYNPAIMKNYYTEDEIREGQELQAEALAKLLLKYPDLNKKQESVEIAKSPIEKMKDLIIACFSKRVMFEELEGKVFDTVKAIEPHKLWIDGFCGQLIKFSINKNEFYLLQISDGYSILDFYSIPDEFLEKIEELIKNSN